MVVVTWGGSCCIVSSVVFPWLGFSLWGFGFGVLTLGFWLWGFDLGVLTLGYWLWGIDFEVLTLGFWLWGFDFGVLNSYRSLIMKLTGGKREHLMDDEYAAGFPQSHVGPNLRKRERDWRIEKRCRLQDFPRPWLQRVLLSYSRSHSRVSNQQIRLAYEWMNKWMNERINEWMNAWTMCVYNLVIGKQFEFIGRRDILILIFTLASAKCSIKCWRREAGVPSSGWTLAPLMPGMTQSALPMVGMVKALWSRPWKSRIELNCISALARSTS